MKHRFTLEVICLGLLLGAPSRAETEGLSNLGQLGSQLGHTSGKRSTEKTSQRQSKHETNGTTTSNLPPPLSKKAARKQLDGSSTHPQLQRTRKLIDDLMAKRYGPNWRFKGKAPSSSMVDAAIRQATKEYTTHYTLARGLLSLAKAKARTKDDSRNKDAKRTAAPRSASATKHKRGRVCSAVKKVADDLGIGLLKLAPDKKKRHKLGDNLGLGLGIDSADDSASCADQAQMLAVEVHRSEKLFGEFPLPDDDALFVQDREKKPSAKQEPALHRGSGAGRRLRFSHGL